MRRARFGKGYGCLIERTIGKIAKTFNVLPSIEKCASVNEIGNVDRVFALLSHGRRDHSNAVGQDTRKSIRKYGIGRRSASTNSVDERIEIQIRASVSAPIGNAECMPRTFREGIESSVSLHSDRAKRRSELGNGLQIHRNFGAFLGARYAAAYAFFFCSPRIPISCRLSRRIPEFQNRPRSMILSTLPGVIRSSE